MNFIGDATSSDLPTWTRDGRLRPQPPRRSASVSYSARLPGNVSPIIVSYRVDHLLKGAVSRNPFSRFLCRLGGIYPVYPSPQSDSVTFPMPSAWRTADFEVGQGVGKFRPLVEGKMGEPPLFVGDERTPPTDYHVAIVVAGKKVPPKVRYRFTLPKQTTYNDWRFIGITKAGERRELPILAVIPTTPLRQAIAESDDKLGAFPRFALEIRKYEVVKLKNLPLKPKPR